MSLCTTCARNFAEGRPDQCYIGTYAGFEVDFTMDLYAFDSNCKLMAYVNRIPQQSAYNFESELPLSIVVDTADLDGTGMVRQSSSD